VHFKLCFFPLLKYKNSSTALVIRNIVNSSAENTGSADWPVNDPLTQKSAVWDSHKERSARKSTQLEREGTNKLKRTNTGLLGQLDSWFALPNMSLERCHWRMSTSGRPFDWSGFNCNVLYPISRYIYPRNISKLILGHHNIYTPLLLGME